jgi:hypothetical protein
MGMPWTKLTFDKAQPFWQDVVCLVLDQHLATIQRDPRLSITTQLKQTYMKKVDMIQTFSA